MTENWFEPDLDAVGGDTPSPRGQESFILRSPIAGEARALMHRVAAVVSTAQRRTRRTSARAADTRARIEASEDAIREWQTLRTQLCGVVTALAQAQRAANVAPERMLVAIKATAEEAGVTALMWPDKRSIIADVVKWSIEAYYTA